MTSVIMGVNTEQLMCRTNGLRNYIGGTLFTVRPGRDLVKESVVIVNYTSTVGYRLAYPLTILLDLFGI